MGLKNSQKNYIKKSIHQLPLDQIAADLGLSDKEILDYLRKKWRKDKYEKFVKKIEEKKGGHFEPKKFFRKNKFIFFFLALLAFIVYANSINNAFVSDDISSILKNENVGRISNIFKPTISACIQKSFHFILFHIFGTSPAPFRLLNILLHIGSVLLIFSILNIISNKTVALFAASLFAIHPILTESVTWISGLSYALYGFFLLLSFYLYLISSKKKKLYYFSIIFFALTCLTSPNAIPLFLFFLLYEFIFGDLKKKWKKTIPYILISIVFSIISIRGLEQRISGLETFHYQQAAESRHSIAQIPIAVTSYLKLIIWPSDLTLYHTEMVFSPGIYFFMIVLFILFLGTLVFTYRKNKEVFFWLTFFLIALSVPLTPLGVAWIVAERYVYLASLGIFVIIAIGFDWLYEKIRNNHKKSPYQVSPLYKGGLGGILSKPENFVYIFFAIIIIILSIRTIIRNNDWKNEDNLWIATARTSPSGQTIHNNLGDVYGRQGDHKKAIEEFKKAIEINPSYADAYHNLANTYGEIGQTDLAIENYKKAAELNPRLWQSYQNLAAIYFEKQDYDKALEYIQKALEINPQNENLKQNLEVIKSKN